ncbi:MAG: 1-acyl-sn-glycerol-3-phosphate acyltransferase, partial [Anaerolineae bacterium]|nr:1-acyl-sn-glycerol-3-phosphate acyltransferase [Anaerolineae bacterium]
MQATEEIEEITYPRRRVIRVLLRRVAEAVFFALTDFHLVGKENFPQEGPLLVVGNHFSFIDPVAVIRVVPWPVEFVGGFRMPNAPPIVTWIPKVWGYYPVFRGTGARGALGAAEIVLKRGGILGIFPE